MEARRVGALVGSHVNAIHPGRDSLLRHVCHVPSPVVHSQPLTNRLSRIFRRWHRLIQFCSSLKMVVTILGDTIMTLDKKTKALTTLLFPYVPSFLIRSRQPNHVAVNTTLTTTDTDGSPQSTHSPYQPLFSFILFHSDLLLEQGSRLILNIRRRSFGVDGEQNGPSGKQRTLEMQFKTGSEPLSSTSMSMSDRQDVEPGLVGARDGTQSQTIPVGGLFSVAHQRLKKTVR